MCVNVLKLKLNQRTLNIVLCKVAVMLNNCVHTDAVDLKALPYENADRFDHALVRNT